LPKLTAPGASDHNQVQLYKIQLLRAAARYPGGRGGEGPKCPEFSGARVEISGARLEFQEAQVVVRGAAQGRWAEVAGHCDKGPGQRRGQAGEVSGAERGKHGFSLIIALTKDYTLSIIPRSHKTPANDVGNVNFRRSDIVSPHVFC